MISQKKLKNVLRYDPETGEFVRLLTGKKAGCVNTSASGSKYIRIMVLGDNYYAHRLAILYMDGIYDASREVDHINGNGLDNRYSNLRFVSRIENGRNQKLPKHNNSGICGVSWSPKDKAWKARIHIEGKDKHLGNYDNIFDAACARKTSEKMHGFHANHGVERRF